MSPGPRVLLVVSGGIAAYKACALARELGRAGCTVRAVLTEAATRFVTPLSFEALTGEPAFHSLWQPRLGPMEHIDQARWAQVVLCAPATADLLARMAAGRGDELATTLLLAYQGPLAVAPAMNPAMWTHPATRANLETLTSRGVQVFAPDEGDTACGEVGAGRLVEPEVLAIRLLEWWERLAAAAPAGTQAGAAAPALQVGASPVEEAGTADREAAPPGEGPLHGKRVLLTAGPTREHLDPVRFLSNPSTGTMGAHLATAFLEAGAAVTVVHGPMRASLAEGVEAVPVVSAADMHAAVMARVEAADVFVASAAVADWTPAEVAAEKQAKVEGPMRLEMVRTRDILAEVGTGRRPGQVLVGFAAETHDVLARGRAKLERKGVDLLVCNRVGAPGTGFGGEDNLAAILEDGLDGPARLEAVSKRELARALVARVAARMQRGE